MLQTDRICICGLPGGGKTTLAKYLASLAEPNLIIIDPLGQYTNFPKECLRYPKRMDPMFLEGIAKELWNRKDTVLLIEEAEQFMKQGKPLLEYTSGLVRMGRNWGIGIIVVTRRIQELSKEYFGHCQQVFFYKCDLKSREYIGDLLGNEFVKPQVKRETNTTGYVINTLPKFAFLHYNLETEEARVSRLNFQGIRPHMESIAKSKANAPVDPVGPDTKAPIQKQEPEVAEKQEQRPQERESKLWSPGRK